MRTSRRSKPVFPPPPRPRRRSVASSASRRRGNKNVDRTNSDRCSYCHLREAALPLRDSGCVTLPPRIVDDTPACTARGRSRKAKKNPTPVPYQPPSMYSSPHHQTLTQQTMPIYLKPRQAPGSSAQQQQQECLRDLQLSPGLPHQSSFSPAPSPSTTQQTQPPALPQFQPQPPLQQSLPQKTHPLPQSQKQQQQTQQKQLAMQIHNQPNHQVFRTEALPMYSPTKLKPQAGCIYRTPAVPVQRSESLHIVPQSQASSPRRYATEYTPAPVFNGLRPQLYYHGRPLSSAEPTCPSLPPYIMNAAPAVRARSLSSSTSLDIPPPEPGPADVPPPNPRRLGKSVVPSRGMQKQTLKMPPVVAPAVIHASDSPKPPPEVQPAPPAVTLEPQVQLAVKLQSSAQPSSQPPPQPSHLSQPSPPVTKTTMAMAGAPKVEPRRSEPLKSPVPSPAVATSVAVHKIGITVPPIDPGVVKAAFKAMARNLPTQQQPEELAGITPPLWVLNKEKSHVATVVDSEKLRASAEVKDIPALLQTLDKQQDLLRQYEDDRRRLTQKFFQLRDEVRDVQTLATQTRGLRQAEIASKALSPQIPLSSRQPLAVDLAQEDSPRNQQRPVSLKRQKLHQPDPHFVEQRPTINSLPSCSPQATQQLKPQLLKPQLTTEQPKHENAQQQQQQQQPIYAPNAQEVPIQRPVQQSVQPLTTLRFTQEQSQYIPQLTQSPKPQSVIISRQSRPALKGTFVDTLQQSPLHVLSESSQSSTGNKGTGFRLDQPPQRRLRRLVSPPFATGQESPLQPYAPKRNTRMQRPVQEQTRVKRLPPTPEEPEEEEEVMGMRTPELSYSRDYPPFIKSDSLRQNNQKGQTPEKKLVNKMPKEIDQSKRQLVKRESLFRNDSEGEADENRKSESHPLF